MLVGDPLLFPAHQLLGGRTRGAAMLGVFLVSAVAHEYVFCFVLGFFYPVMLLMFLVVGGEFNPCGPRGEAARGRRPRWVWMASPRACEGSVTQKCWGCGGNGGNGKGVAGRHGGNDSGS